MADPFLGEIKIVAFTFPQKGFAFCNGQILSIQQNQALFALFGTFYGGNGTTTFALPNLQGRVPVHFGGGFVQGQTGGEESHTVNISEMPAHSHAAAASSLAANATSVAGNTWGAVGVNPYHPTPNTTLNAAAVSSIGGSQPHENRSPFLVLNFVVALVGLFPSQN